MSSEADSARLQIPDYRRQLLDPSSRTSSNSSLGSHLEGHVESTSLPNIIFRAANSSDSSSSSSHHITPPDSRAGTPDGFESQFDDHLLPASPRLRRRRSSPGLGGGETREQHETERRRKSSAGIKLSVSLEKLPAEKGEKNRRYALKVDNELRELLLAGVSERKKHESKGQRRKRFGDLAFTQQFTKFDRINSEKDGMSPFHGFFVLMWLGVIILMLKTAAETYRSTGSVFKGDILSIMFARNHLFDCLLSDCIMFYGSTLWNVPLQRAVMRGTISWNFTGWALQSIWQVVFIASIIQYTLYKEWPWIQTVFLVLHCLVTLMKQHSYAFYNGYLSVVYKRQRALISKLLQLKEAGAQSPTTLDEDGHFNATVGNLDISQLPEELTPEQLSHFATLVLAEIDACKSELSLSAANTAPVTYPENLTYTNYFTYLHFPTVVYELCYPRSTGINWSYVAEKAAATFGVLGIMIVVSQHWIYPVVLYANSLHSLPLSGRLAEFPWILLKLVFPFMGEYLCVWYLIWELILNLLAELTYFADRGFYGDWWNSTTWDAFARDWNKPVHNFLLRHVYHSSISTFQISRQKATLITFLISAMVHELVMWCLFKKLRGYLLVGQMMQLPLVGLSRTRWLKGKNTLGNVMFWIGIWTGPGFLSASYLIM